MSIARTQEPSQGVASYMSPQPIVDAHIGPITQVADEMPYSNGHGMLPILYVHLIENYVILNYSWFPLIEN